MRFRFVWVVTVVLVAAALFLPAGEDSARAGSAQPPFNKMQQRLLSGFLSYELGEANSAATNTLAPTQKSVSPAPSGADKLPNYYPTDKNGCVARYGSNIRVNQNCLNLSDSDLQGRAQSQNETSIAQDPNNTKHLVASYNDYRRGDGTCGISYSLDNGESWEDSTVPNNFVRGATNYGAAREYFHASGDTAVAWDSRGNAYLLCQMFMRGQPATNNPDNGSGIYVFRSTLNNGASLNFPARPVVEANPAGDNFLDKPYMTVDNNPNSPFRDRVYVTWTNFASDGTAYIWEAYSDDYAESFSAPVLVSANSSLCTETFGYPTPNGDCIFNQDSQPFTGPNGTLYVTWNNFNNTVSGNDNRNQVFLAKSSDGGASFGALVKVADYYDLPDCATYQGGADEFRACVPEKGPTQNSVFRATNMPVGGVNPKNPQQVVVTFGSYINVHSKEPGCVPAGFSSSTGINLYNGVKAPGKCNNDILFSVSQDGGATFTGTTTDPRMLPTVNQQPAQATTDQWWQWAAFTSDGVLAVSYYDRQYGNDETTGYMDFSLSGSDHLTTFGTKRATSSSMPPPTQFSGEFLGDYTGLAALGNEAHPLWADTRPLDLFLCPGTGVPGTPPGLCSSTSSGGVTLNDEDAFTVRVPVPTGH